MYLYMSFYFILFLFFAAPAYYCYYYYYSPYARGKIMKENLICYLPKTWVKYLTEKESETHSFNAWFMSPVVLSALSQCPLHADTWELWHFTFTFVSGTTTESHYIYVRRLLNAGIRTSAPTLSFLSPFPIEAWLGNCQRVGWETLSL